MNDITIRSARPEDVRPALALALWVFMIYSGPIYSPEAIAHFEKSCADADAYMAEHMFVAFDGANMIGMACTRGEGHISKLYVDPAYHRQGIATALMDRLIAAMGVSRVELGSSPHAVPFYLKYGFVPTDKEQHKHGATWTPMAMDI